MRLPTVDFARADPFALARWQLAYDQQLTRRFPELAQVKSRRMLASPHALFRGSAPLFFGLAHARVKLERLPRGAGALVGDMHLENLGAYRSDRPDAPVVFDINDFDEASYGPQSVDLLRLATSVLLAARTFGDTARDSLALLEHGLDHYARVRTSGRSLAAPPCPRAIERLIKRVEKRKRRQLLDERAPLVAGLRSFVRGPRYLDLPRDIFSRADDLLQAWLAALDPGSSTPHKVRVLDAAQRVAGTGSLGGLRIALLVDDGGEQPRLVELKEIRPPALDAGLPSLTRRQRGPAVDPAARVVTATRALIPWPSSRLAALPPMRLRRETLSLIGRTLTPQEDKLDLAKLQAWSEKERLLTTVFHLLGAAHRRGADRAIPPSFGGREREALIDAAVLLAGAFESVAVAYARLAP